MERWTGKLRAVCLGARRKVPFTAWTVLTAGGVGLALVAAGVAPSSAGAARSSQRIIVFSAPVHEAFVANADDEARGGVNNPFGTHTVRAAGNEHNNGPFAGDEALFSFDVYTSSKLDGKVGSAVYTCQYYFSKNAFCDVSLELAGGTLIGAGALNFDARKFALAITGGYGKYQGARGDVEATPSGKHAQRLTIVLE